MRKVLRSEATEFHYERGEQPLPRIGPWQDALDQMLASNEAKPSRERLTLIRIFQYAGSVTKAGTTLCGAMRGCGSAIARRPQWTPSFRSVSLRAKPISSTGATRWC